MKPDELERAYRDYGREVYLYALSLCRDPHEAEELTSDAFTKPPFSGGKPGAAPLLAAACLPQQFLIGAPAKVAPRGRAARSSLGTLDADGRLIAGEERQALYRGCCVCLHATGEVLVHVLFSRPQDSRDWRR